MNEYGIFYEFVSQGAVSRAEPTDGCAYEDVIGCAIECLVNQQSYDAYEAQTLVNNSFNCDF
jgi:hypothetical protein